MDNWFISYVEGFYDYDWFNREEIVIDEGDNIYDVVDGVPVSSNFLMKSNRMYSKSLPTYTTSDGTVIKLKGGLKDLPYLVDGKIFSNPTSSNEIQIVKYKRGTVVIKDNKNIDQLVIVNDNC